MWGFFAQSRNSIDSVGGKKGLVPYCARSLALRPVLGNPCVHSNGCIFHFLWMDVHFETDSPNHWLPRVESTAAKNLVLRLVLTLGFFNGGLRVGKCDGSKIRWMFKGFTVLFR